MAKIVIGPINKGLKTDRLPFNIDKDSFPQLINAYQWRGRIKRKRGTQLLNRLTRFFNSTSISYNTGSTFITLDGSGNGNLITGFSLQTNGNIVPGSVTLIDLDSPGLSYTDPGKNGILVGNPSGSGTINYATGAILIAVSAGHRITAIFNYTPDLPVMGLEDLVLQSTQFPGNLAFDTKYSYNIVPTEPYPIYDVSFYKNPPVDAINLPGYIPKTNFTPVTWNGNNYQQFWSTNYQGAFWVTNGIDVPFTGAHIGMQFKHITGIAIITPGNGTTIPAVADLTIVAHGLVQGDFIFVNEVVGMLDANGISTINFQTGYVTSADPQAANTVRVTFPFAILAGAYISDGIAQYLTNRSDKTKDVIRWYDGDPTNGNATNPTLTQNFGWVNFMPPLSLAPFTIADLSPAIYYLVGARMIFPFKDRLLFFGVVVQTSTGVPIYLQDTIVYSQNGTPYYTASFTGDPSLPTTVFHPVLVPVNQTATPNAYWADQTGFGGNLPAGVEQPMLTVAPNEDVLIIGFTNLQTRLVYTGNDILPFNLFTINSELGSGSTFSSVIMDKGIFTRGNRGFVITSQTGAERFDPDIPDQAFQINLINNGSERVCAQRDFVNEWIYFTYLTNREDETVDVFPDQTLQYNYRDNSWAIFDESYTTYGTFRPVTGYTWATIGQVYPTWNSWNDPWEAGISTLLQQRVMAGNQQGFVLIRGEGTNESVSLYITGFSGSVVTSPNHNLTDGDYITISGVLGTIGTLVNGLIFSVVNVTTNTFQLNPTIGSGTYLGGGLITRMYVPYIQTMQFPVSWEMGRKTRLGVQQYLFSTTTNGQVTLLIFLSQNSASAYNEGNIMPVFGSVNNSLIYSTILYTCPESTNLGLTPANTNLQMVTAIDQDQIWHRMNTSLLGDTVQIGFTMSDSQMRDTTFSNQFVEIELHSAILEVTPSMVLA